jgi:transcriptional regulator with XRE-family HTH domain
MIWRKFMNLTEKIRALRENAELTQAELAERVGVSEKIVSKWECGETKPSAEILPALADAFDISIDALFDHRHDLRGDLMLSVRDYIRDTDPAEVFDRMQEIVSYMAFGANIRQSEDGGWYTPEVMQEIIGEWQELIDRDDPKPQIFTQNSPSDEMEMLTNIRNDRLKFAVLQQYPGDMFEKILDHYENYRYIFEFLTMPGADSILKAAYSGTLPSDVTADYVCELTGAAPETIAAFLKLVQAREISAVIKGQEVTIYRWCWYTGTNLRAVIAAAYMITEKWGGHR